MKYRRLSAAAACVAWVALAPCAVGAQASEGRLSARRVAVTDTPIYGERLIESASGEGYSYVPQRYRAGVAMPFCLLLHGATGDAQRFLRRFERLADSVGVILVAPKSHGVTWDLMHGAFGYDVLQIDALLRDSFRRYRIDPARTCIAGFSDGASYALSLGRVNGDLFTHIIAFSPGFIVTTARAFGKPKVFIAHGTNDEILPIEETGHPVVEKLSRAGYPVTFREFAGPHTVNADIALEAFRWVATP